MLYTSKENKRIKEIKKLTTKKYRDLEGLFLVEGKHLIEEAYKTNQLETLILLENEEYPLPVETIYVTKEIMHLFSDLDSTPRMMGIVKKKTESLKLGSKILILDGIQDPGNLGTILRSSVAFHIDTVILSKDTVDLYNPKVIRSSQGMFFYQSLLRLDLSEILPVLKEQGYQILGTKVDGGTNLKNYKKTEKYAIIMGNEGNGMKEETSSFCDDFLFIPMDQKCESLNVGVATSIILYELDI